MTEIKTLSFDLWGTLIKSNPNFSDARAEYLKQYTHMTVEEILYTIKKIKHDIDTKVESFGFHFRSFDVYSIIHNELALCDVTIEDVRNKCTALFLDNMPELIHGDIAEKLNILSDYYKMYISSNTVLQDGQYLRKVLKHHNILNCFNETFFSNELGFSKPDPRFFRVVHMAAMSKSSYILHIGDNLVTDYIGSTAYGFMSTHLNEDCKIENVLEQYVK